MDETARDIKFLLGDFNAAKAAILATLKKSDPVSNRFLVGLESSAALPREGDQCTADGYRFGEIGNGRGANGGVNNVVKEQYTKPAKRLRMEGKFQEAIELLTQGLKRYPENTRLLCSMAEVYRRIRRFEDTIQ